MVLYYTVQYSSSGFLRYLEGVAEESSTSPQSAPILLSPRKSFQVGSPRAHTLAASCGCRNCPPCAPHCAPTASSFDDDGFACLAARNTHAWNELRACTRSGRRHILDWGGAFTNTQRQHGDIATTRRVHITTACLPLPSSHCHWQYSWQQQQLGLLVY